MADVALSDIHLRFAWQAWRLGHWAGSRSAWTGLVAGDAAALCVAGEALDDTWQAWRLGHWAGKDLGAAAGCLILVCNQLWSL